MLRVLNSTKNESSAVFPPFSPLKSDNNKRNERASQVTWKKRERWAVCEKCIDPHISFSNILFTIHDYIGHHRDLLSPSELCTYHLVSIIFWKLKLPFKVSFMGSFRALAMACEMLWRLLATPSINYFSHCWWPLRGIRSVRRACTNSTINSWVGAQYHIVLM